MAKFHEDKIYGIKIRESANDGSDFSNPEADYRIAFLGEDGLWHVKDSAGTVTDAFTAGAGVVVPWLIAPDGGAINLTNRSVGAANRALYAAITIPAACTVTGVRIPVGTQSGNVSVALYTAAGPTRVATSGAVACPAGGASQTIAFSGSYAAAAGRYWLCLTADNNTATFGFNQQVSSGISGPIGAQFEATAHPAPATATMSAGGAMPAFILLVSGGYPT